MTDKQKFDANEVTELVIAGAKRTWAEKEPVALIGLLMGVIMAALFWPLVQFSATAGERFLSDDPAVLEALARDAAEVLPFYFLSVLISLAANIMLARLAAHGRAEVFAGGLRSFAERLKWVFWRYLGFTGWLLLGVMALWMAGTMIGVLLALLGINAVTTATGGPSMLLAAILLVPAIAGVLLIYGALGLSVVSESSDHHLRIKDAWLCLKGQRIKLAAAILVSYLGIVVLLGSVMGALIPQGEVGIEEMRLTLSIFSIATAIITYFYTFIWLSMTAIVAESVDWTVLEVEDGGSEN